MAGEPPFTPIPFPGPQQNATTVGPSFTNTISPSAKFRRITAAIVLRQDATGLHADVYRESTTAHGYFSCDRYERETGKWVCTGEAKVKFERPEIPAAAKHENIDGHDFYTVEALTDVERAMLRELVQGVGVP